MLNRCPILHWLMLLLQMDVLLFHRAEYERLYNCSAYSIDKIPLEQRQHPILGYSILALFAVYEVSHGYRHCVSLGNRSARTTI